MTEMMTPPIARRWFGCLAKLSRFARISTGCSAYLAAAKKQDLTLEVLQAHWHTSTIRIIILEGMDNMRRSPLLPTAYEIQVKGGVTDGISVRAGPGMAELA